MACVLVCFSNNHLLKLNNKWKSCEVVSTLNVAHCAYGNISRFINGYEQINMHRLSSNIKPVDRNHQTGN